MKAGHMTYIIKNINHGKMEVLGTTVTEIAAAI